jgi:hypothetical protein
MTLQARCGQRKSPSSRPTSQGFPGARHIGSNDAAGRPVGAYELGRAERLTVRRDKLELGHDRAGSGAAHHRKRAGAKHDRGEEQPVGMGTDGAGRGWEPNLHTPAPAVYLLAAGLDAVVLLPDSARCHRPDRWRSRRAAMKSARRCSCRLRRGSRPSPSPPLPEARSPTPELAHRYSEATPSCRRSPASCMSSRRQPVPG